jgi:peptidoglycan/LPS O-acetylase OafA/YrhL
MAAATAGGRQLLGLDLTRFAAAFMVMAFHIAAGTALGPYTRWGWVGVEVFFVLSGFVIAYTAAEATAGRFLRNRVVRLLPSVWLCGSISAAVWWLHSAPPDLGQRYIATLSLWPTGPWVDGVYWTLPIEVAFYALIFSVLAAGAFNRVTQVFALLSTVSCVYWLGRLSLQFWPDAAILAWVRWLPAFWATQLLLYHGCYFGLGGVLWVISRSGWSWGRGAVAGVGVVGGVVQIAFASRAWSATLPLVEPETVWLAAVLAIWLSIWQAGRIGQLLGRYAGGIRLAGLATYPLYLLHDDMGSMLRDVVASVVPLSVAAAITGAVFVGAALIVAGCIEPAMQRPLRSALDALARLPTRRRAVVVDRTVGGAAPGDG